MNIRDRVRLRKERTRDNYQLSVNTRADAASRTPYITGRYAGFDVNARSTLLQTVAGRKVRGVSVSARTLGKRFSVQRTQSGRNFAL